MMFTFRQCVLSLSSSGAYAANNVAIQNRVVHDEIMWYHIMALFRFRLSFGCDESAGKEGIKEKSIISGPIWTRRELERLDCVYMALIFYDGGSSHEMELRSQTLQRSKATAYRAEYFFRVKVFPQLSRSLAPRSIGVSCGVVKYFMLCYHRTWWRRWRRK